MINGNLELSLPASLPLTGSGIGVILHHLARVLSRLADDVEALTSSAADNFLDEGVTPAMGTWGGASVMDDLEAGGINALAGMEGPT